MKLWQQRLLARQTQATKESLTSYVRPLTGIPSIIGSKPEGLVSLIFLYISFLCGIFLVYIMLLFPLAQSRPLVGKVSNYLFSWKYPCFVKILSIFSPRISMIMNLASCQVQSIISFTSNYEEGLPFIVFHYTILHSTINILSNN